MAHGSRLTPNQMRVAAGTVQLHPEHMKARALFFAMTLGVLLFPSCSKPSFQSLEKSCGRAVKSNSRIEAVENWLKANGISYGKEETPKIVGNYNGSMENVLLYNFWQFGIPREAVERSDSCISFWNYPVTWGGGANGFFLFAADGSLIEYGLTLNNHPL
jgi:hypothetical protein